MTPSPEGGRWSAAWTAGQLTGAVLVALALLLLAGLTGWSLARRGGAATGACTVTPAVHRVLLVGAVGCVLVVGGIVLALTTGGPVADVVTYSGSYQPLSCPGDPGCAPSARPVVLDGSQLSGLGVAGTGAIALAGVAGWLLGRDQRVDQG